MLFTCSPPGATTPGRFPGVARGRGKHWTVDIHCHVGCAAAGDMVKDLFAPKHEPGMFFANDHTRKVNREQGQRIAPQLNSVEKRLADMDTMGIDIQALAPAPMQTYYWTEPELAIQELERTVKKLGFRGVELNTNIAGEDLSADKFRKFFAKAEELGVVVFLHPIGYTEASRLVDHYFNNVIGNPLESTVAVSHLIFGGVLESCPKLKVVVAHGGGYLPAYAGRIDDAAAARPDCCVHLKHMPTTYLKRLYFDTMVFTPHQLEYLVQQYGADHILLGTDYPYDMGENDPIGFIESARLNAAERKAVMGHSAANLLSIPIPEKWR